MLNSLFGFAICARIFDSSITRTYLAQLIVRVDFVKIRVLGEYFEVAKLRKEITKRCGNALVQSCAQLALDSGK